MWARLGAVAFAALLCSLVAGGAEARSDALRLQLVARGFRSPVYVTAPKSEPGRLYVVEQRGVVRVLVDGRLRARPFLDISRLVVSGGEQGLLSIAFNPDYAKNRLLYVNYTDLDGDTRVVEYRSNGVTVLESTARQLLFVDQPFVNHNGGQLQFGPDGKLYVGMGDGGSSADPRNYGQNLKTRLAKLLRTDPFDVRWRVAGYGLRNPWRFSFDRLTGDLYIGDVGEGSYEELDYRRKGALVANFGWSRFEGNFLLKKNVVLQGNAPYVRPILEYGHEHGCSVTGGYVYRGTAVSAAAGRYFYGDYCSGNVWSLKVVAGKATSVRREPFRARTLSSFGEDARGELYLVSHAGSLYRLAG